MEYKIGDIVILGQPSHHWNRYMEEYAGQIVTIANAGTREFTIEEDGRTWWYLEKDVVGMASEEVVLVRKEEKRLKLEQFKEKYKHLVFSAEGVGELANSVFGEERVEVNKGRENEFNVTIHFPHIVITNERGQSHNIKDIFIRYDVKIWPNKFEGDDYKAEIKFEGKRQTLSLKEYESQYRHSHLYRECNNFAPFCLGSSDYSLILTHLGMDLSENAWLTTFLALENYLKWESLEGGPYILIEEIKYKNKVGNNLLNAEVGKFVSKIPRQCWEFNNGVRLITAHPDLYDCINEHSTIRKLNSYTQKEEEELIISLNERFVGNTGSILTWKGEKRPIKVYSDYEQPEHIGRDLVEEYSDIITKQGTIYFKKQQYEQKKQQYKDKVFRKVRA